MTAKALHHCPNCRAALIAARISRYINERCMSNLWCCEACGHEHETPAIFSHNGKRCTAESHVDF
jgi:ribosomal protein L37AE/L43A